MRLKALLPLAAIALALTTGCKHSALSSSEYAYVSAPQAFLRDRISAVYNKVGTIQNGERVVVLQHDRRFVKIRSEKGIEGWVEQRYLVDQGVYDQLDALSKKFSNAPAQARAAVRNDVNMHVTPARDSEKLFQLKENDKLDLLQRAVTNKNAVTKVATPIRRTPKPAKAQTKEASAKKTIELPPTPAPPVPPQMAYDSLSAAAPVPKPGPDPGPPEDWWLVRDGHGRIGWVLGRMLDVDVPLEIAQYAEGKRVVAAFVLSTVEDLDSDKPNHQVPYYLMLTNEPHDGQTQDFDAIRVFTWNTKRHRYETAYRERDLNGYLPVSVAKENFGKDGTLPTFTIRMRDENGASREKKYRMEGVLVRRVYAAGEQPEGHVRQKANGSAAKMLRARARRRRR